MSVEEIQRFLEACLTFRLALKLEQPLSNQQLLLLKTQIYDLICDLQEIERKQNGTLHSSPPPRFPNQTAP
jgi:hypothetical protein